MELVQKSSPLNLQVEMKNTYQNLDQTSFNVVGEIKGTDKATELVVSARTWIPGTLAKARRTMLQGWQW